MTFRIVLGRAGTGKSKLCIGEISRELKETPCGPPLVYIVPEQAAFQAEHALATSPGLGGIIRAQVLSFRRLAWRVMQEVGGKGQLFIDDTGKVMVLRKIIERNKESLSLFKHVGEQPGALENLIELYNELKRSCIPVEKIKEYMSNIKGSQHKEIDGDKINTGLMEKIKDLELIFTEMDKELKELYLDSEDYLKFLADNIFRTSYLIEARLWVDGFYGFTNQEYKILEELIKHCRQVTVCLCLDDDYNLKETVDELNPFYPAAVTCQRLKDIAGKLGIIPETIVRSMPFEKSNRFSQNSALSYLEQNLHAHPVKPFKDGTQEDMPLCLTAASNRRSEVEALAHQLIVLARDKGYRWKDMAVMAGNLDDYADTISTLLTDYDIPFFLDLKRPVLNHPLIEFIRSALEIVNYNWGYDAVFRCVKTGMLIPDLDKEKGVKDWREGIYQLENYVLCFGIRGSHWLSSKRWQYLQRDSLEENSGDDKISQEEEAYLQLINETKELIREPLITFQEEIIKAVTVKKKAKALYNLLQGVNAPEYLEKWSGEALEKGNPEKAREHQQVYKRVIELMDQIVEIMGDEEMSINLFSRILESGLQDLRLSLVPPSLDQVLVGDLERTRAGNIKFTFILGVNDGVLPSRPQEDGVFTEQERESLINWGLDLAPGSRRRVLDEQFLIYIALTRAAEGLWLSYPLADEEGRMLVPSLLVSRMKEIFPCLKESNANGDLKEEEQLSFRVVHPRRTMSQLAVQLSRWRKGETIDSFWWEIYNWYAGKEEWHQQGKLLLGGLFYINQEEPLDKETSRRLYGEHLKASVSRLEKYRSCPFSHFALYGLGLKERKIYRLEAPDIGRFFHAALYNLLRAIKDKGLEWSEISSEEFFCLAEEEVEKLLPRLQSEILLSNSRYRFLAKKLKDTVGRTAVFMGEHFRRSKFKPVGLEISFGDKKDLPPIVFKLEDGCSVELVGRIDRVDLARGDEGDTYLRVIDYKSGDSKLNLAEVYHGISLQMLAYMDVVINSAREWLGEEALPAAMLYFRVHAPLIKSNRVISPEEIKKEMSKRYKMKGKVLANLEAVKLMDSGLQSSGYSDVIPVAVTKDDTFYKNSEVMEQSRFELLRCHMRQTIKNIAHDITKGRLYIAPFHMGGKKACKFCSYRAVCQFDPLTQGNYFRYFREEKEEVIWSLLDKGKEGFEGGITDE